MHPVVISIRRQKNDLIEKGVSEFDAKRKINVSEQMWGRVGGWVSGRMSDEKIFGDKKRRKDDNPQSMMDEKWSKSKKKKKEE